MNKLDKANYLKRVIIVSWIALAFCFVIKIFGGNLFEIACANENFIAVCDYADNHLWAYFLIGATHCFISLYFYMLAILQQLSFKKHQLVVVTITVIVGSCIKIWNSNAGWVFDIWQMFIMPALFLKTNFKKYFRIVLGAAFLILFQFISMITKNIALDGMTNDGTLVNVIYSIDVFIMSILYYLYSNQLKKEGT
jgi:hypothetical protein